MAKADKLRNFHNIFTSLFVRILLVIHSLLIVWRCADAEQNDTFWLLGLVNLLIAIEGIYRARKYAGQESKWFSPCFFLYLMATLPPLWVLEFDRLDRYENAANDESLANLTVGLSAFQGVVIPFELEPDNWLSLLEQSLLFLLILGRWFLPRGKLSRDQLSQLLFVYIGIASDVMELFILFEEPDIRQDHLLTILTLGAWSLSLFQFCIGLTAYKMTNRRRRAVGFKQLQDTKEESDFVKKRTNPCVFLVQTEIWSLFVSIIFMDGPFLAVRLYAIIIHNILGLGILFFAAKNILIISLLVYRMFVIGCGDWTYSDQLYDEETPSDEAKDHGDSQMVVHQRTIIRRSVDKSFDKDENEINHNASNFSQGLTPGDESNNQEKCIIDIGGDSFESVDTKTPATYHLNEGFTSESETVSQNIITETDKL